MKDLLDDRLRTELHRLVDATSASPMMRQRVEHRLDRAPRSRAMVLVTSAAAVVLLIIAVVALAGGSSSKPSHVASGGVTTAPAGSALEPQGVMVVPDPPPQPGDTPTSDGSGAPTTSVTSAAAVQIGQPGATTSPTTAPSSHGFATPNQSTTSTVARPPRAAPSVTDTTGPYGVEVIGEVDGGNPGGYFRRTDDRGSTLDGPDSYGAMTVSGWGGTPGPRYLSIASVGDASQGGEPGRIFVYGAVGTDAVRVDLMLPDGRQLPTTLGTVTVGQLRFWVVGYWPNAAGGYGTAVATDAQGNTWQVDGGGIGYGYTP